MLGHSHTLNTIVGFEAALLMLQQRTSTPQSQITRVTNRTALITAKNWLSHWFSDSLGAGTPAAVCCNRGGQLSHTIAEPYRRAAAVPSQLTAPVRWKPSTAVPKTARTSIRFRSSRNRTKLLPPLCWAVCGRCCGSSSSTWPGLA